MKRFGLICLTTLLLTACNAQDKRETNISVKDATDHKVELAKPAKKIICLTEICVDGLKSLDMKPAGVLKTSIAHEPEFFKKEKIETIPGTFFEPDVESILAKNPDVVIGLKGTHDNLRKSLGNRLMIVNPNNVDDAKVFLTDLGKLTDKTDKAKQDIDLFDKEFNKVKGKFKDHSSLILFGNETQYNMETTKNSSGYLLSQIAYYPFQSELVANKNADLKEILKVNPEYIFVESFKFGNSKDLTASLAKDKVWQQLDAVKNHHVFEVKTTIWANGRGLNSYRQMITDVENAMR